MTDVKTFLQNIDDRLAAIEVERKSLLELRRMYAPDGAGFAATNTAAAGKWPPVPEAEKVKLIPDQYGRVASTPILLKVIAENPHSSTQDVIDRAMMYIHPETPVPRLRLRWQVKTLLGGEHILRDKDEKLYINPAKAKKAKTPPPDDTSLGL